MTAVRSFRGLGCPQQAFGIFARCAAQNTMLVIFVALWRIFPACGICISRRLSMLRQRIWSYATYTLRRFSRRSYSLTLRRDALNIITTNILNEVGAVSAQSRRRFYENIPLYINRRFLGLSQEKSKSLQFVHHGSPLCINSTADFYSYRKDDGGNMRSA